METVPPAQVTGHEQGNQNGKMKRWILCGALCAFFLGESVASAAVPRECLQLIVGRADGWDSSRGELVLLERSRAGGKWNKVREGIPALFGRRGLAWGIGVAGQEQTGPRKKEGDGRAPAGIFQLGRVFGYTPSSLPGTRLPYYQVTENDAWIEDPKHPDYNRLVRVDPENRPSWFSRQQMKQNDYAHEWKIEIRHNADPPVPGAGSAILFHIWRGPDRPSSGCTTLHKSEILGLMQWLRPEAHPHYVLLPKAEYERLQKAWRLPEI